MLLFVCLSQGSQLTLGCRPCLLLAFVACSIYAVYDGHASSAVSESLSHQLHQAVVQELVAQTDGCAMQSRPLRV